MAKSPYFITSDVESIMKFRSHLLLFEVRAGTLENSCTYLRIMLLIHQEDNGYEELSKNFTFISFVAKCAASQTFKSMTFRIVGKWPPLTVLPQMWTHFYLKRG